MDPYVKYEKEVSESRFSLTGLTFEEATVLKCLFTIGSMAFQNESPINTLVVVTALKSNLRKHPDKFQPSYYSMHDKMNTLGVEMAKVLNVDLEGTK